MKRITLFILVLFTLSLVIHGQSSSKDITVQEILDKNLESIGKKEDLQAVTSRVMVGSVKNNSTLGGGRQFSGAAQFASAGNKLLLALIFDSNEYPYEKVGFDGDKFFLGLPNGNRTALGDFLNTQSVVFKEGVFGGVFSSTWASLSTDIAKKDLKYMGTEKVEDQEYHKIRYSPRNSGDLRIIFYFNVKDYRHSITRYEFTTISRMRSDPTQAIKQKDFRYTLIEYFGDYKNVGKLVLPSTYSLDLVIQTESTRRQMWVVKFDQFFFNEVLEAQVFRVS